ncbi:UNVERIFIED_CONTAM: hypothetical protein RMT77_014936 [Armadillidium vulgare]
MNRLEELSAKKFVVVLCNHSDLKKVILNYSEFPLDTWKKVKKWIRQVHENLLIVLQDVPLLLRSKIPKDLINLIGVQMIKWTKFHKEIFSLSISHAKRLLKANYFLENGAIDRKIGARELVKDINVCTVVRLKIACFYLLTDEIVHLWKELSDHERSEYLEKDVINDGHEHLVQCANYLANGIENYAATSEDFQTFYYNIFKLALNSDSEVAAKHCWNMIDPRKRGHLSKFAIRVLVQKISNISCLLPRRNSHDPEIFLYFEPFVEMLKFIYDELEPEQFKQLFYQFEISVVLEYILHWPYQQLFIVIADLMWGILDTSSYYYLLHMIVYKMNNKIVCNRHNYKLLFRKFWIQSPQYYKNYVYRMESHNDDYNDNDNYDFDYLISSLFSLKELTDFDIRNILIILENCNHDEKEGIVREQGISICQCTLEKNNLKLADLFINSCLTEDSRRDFKRNLLSVTNFGYLFWKLVSRKKLRLTKKIFNWALDCNEIGLFKLDLLNLLSLEEVVDYFYEKPSIVKNIDTFLNWILSPDEAVKFKKNLTSNTEDFIYLFMYSLTNGDFEIIDIFLQWIFQTEIEINCYKANLAFLVIDYPFCVDVRMGFDHLNKFIDWSKLKEFQRKEFKYKIVFLQSTLTYYRDFIDDCNVLPIDEFITWSQMSDASIEEFKRQLIIYEDNTCVISLYSDLILSGKHKEVDLVIEWSKLSGNVVKDFRNRIRILCERKIFVKNIDLRNVETQEKILSLIKWSKSSGESIKNIIRKIIIALGKICIPFTIPNDIEKLECVEDIFKALSLVKEGSR